MTAPTHTPGSTGREERVLPRLVTFTGVDEHTSLLALQVLSADYPVEWGVLFSPDRQGAGRYPPLDFVRSLLARQAASAAPMRLAAHLCGDYAQQFVETGSCGDLKDILPAFRRIQVNTTRRRLDTANLRCFGASNGSSVILQCRESFPDDDSVTWLFDASGGRGIRPRAWPAAAAGPSRLVGYAGGLGPDTVVDAVAQISSSASCFYIDMETHIRDAGDRFCIDRCRSVLHLLYGDAAGLASSLEQAAATGD